MRKILYVAMDDIYIKSFQLPYLKMLKENGYEVHVVTNGEEQIPYCDKKHTIGIESKLFKINNLKSIKQLKKIIDKENFDIIHCHTYIGGIVTRLAAKETRKKGTRIIYTEGGFHFYKGAPLLNWILFYPIEKWLNKYTDTLITINQEDYEMAKDKFARRCRDIQYMNGIGIDEKKFTFEITEDEKLELRKSLGLKKNDFLMVYQAKLNKNNNQKFLINCMENLIKKNNNIHLLLFGSDEINGYYQKIVEEKNLKNNIHFLEHIKDKPKLLKISDIAVSAASKEGFAVNILEALACGLPVVALKSRGTKDIIVNNENGFIVSNSKEFCDIIYEFVENKHDNDIINKNNLLIINQKFDINVISDFLKKIYIINPPIPKIIHYVWMGKKEKPKDILKCMKTWNKLKGYKFIEWNEDNFNINSNEYVKKAYENKKWAFVSDYIRAWAIYNYGGVYFDTDILLIDPKRFEYLLNNNAFIGYESNLMPFTAVFGAEKNNQFVREMLFHYENKQNDFETTNTQWVKDILINKYNCKLGNIEQLLKDNLKLYKKEILCEPSNISVTIHAFTGTWIKNRSAFSKICTFFRKNSNVKLCRLIYSNLIVPIKEKKNERIFNNNNTII